MEDILSIIVPKRWVPHVEPDSEYAEVLDTRVRQVGAYTVGTLEDKTFECYDKTQNKRLYIHFSNGQIILEQV